MNGLNSEYSTPTFKRLFTNITCVNFSHLTIIMRYKRANNPPGSVI